MSRIFTTELDTDDYDSQPVPRAITKLEELDYNPEVERVFSTFHHKHDADDPNSAHLVFETTCLSAPVDDADYHADRMTLFVCDCKGYFFHRMLNENDEFLAPPDIDQSGDPHARAVMQKLKLTTHPDTPSLDAFAGGDD